MSLVTVIKDYIEIVHKIIETSPGYIVQHTNYTDLTTLYFYLINSVKHLFTDIFSLELFKKIAAFPIIVPSIADSMISEISVLDGTFHNVFTFLDAPLENVFSTKNDFLAVSCLEKFFIGLFNSFFLWIPTSAATFLCLRRFVMQGMEIGYIAAIGTMTANIFWLICVLFGIRWIVIPWMSLDILRYWLGFILLIKYFWDNRLPAKEIKSDLSLNVIKTKVELNSILTIFAQTFQFHRNFSNPIQQVFLFHFLLALTEQTSLYPFLSHFSLSAQSTYLESFPSNNLINFILIHSFYLLGIFIGSFSFINFLCWFWEEPAYKVYLWTTKNFQKIRVGDMVRITHFIFQTLTIALACASLPYFSIEYFITKPLGFLPNDQIFHQSQNTAFLTHSTSPILYRSPYYFPRQRFFRYDDWAEYYGKNIPLDTSLYDQGAYRLYPIEDLHYGADYEWTRRRSNHVKIRSRMKRIMWFPRNWATQIWDLAKTWSRRNVAWRNEILSQYQNNWDSKSAPFWEQIVREDLSFENGKSHLQNERKNTSPWVASQNWSQKFFTSGEGFWWNWSAKNTISDNKIWWNWILTKKNKILIDHNKDLNGKNVSNIYTHTFKKINKKNQEYINQKIIFSNYQKLPPSYQLDYWLPQERIISLYSEQSQLQKNKLDFEIATLRKFVRKINKRIQIYFTTLHPLSKASLSFNKRDLYYKKYLFSNSLLLKDKEKKLFYSNQPNPNISLIDSNKTLNSLLNGYSLSNQSSVFNKWNNIDITYKKFNEINLESTKENTFNQIKQSISNKKNNYFTNHSTPLFLTLPAQYYLHKEQSFSRKLQFYGVRTSRQFKLLNNSPIFNFYMKTYFHQYKPTRLYIANTKMKRDLGAGGRNRFKSRQYANKQLKKARILSKTPWIRQWISQSGFLTRRKRLESWIRYSHYSSTEIWAFIMRADIDNFIKRQPSAHLLTTNEERLLHLRRFLLGEHYETLRWYSYMQHYRSMKTKIGGTKSFANRIYNQQFKGTFHKVRHLFALTPSLNGGGMLTFDQPLYNEYSNDNQNTLFNKEFIHEELLADTKTNINSFLVKDKEKNNLNYKFDSEDLIIKASQIIKKYILEITPIRQKLIHKFLKEKNYVDLTNFLWSGQNPQIWLSTTTSRSKIEKDVKIDFKQNSMRSSFSMDQQKKLQSILIFMFNRRKSLAKDYKRGSERLWKKWRKKYLIQKQISKQKNYLAKQDLILSSFYLNKNNLEVNIGTISRNQKTIPFDNKRFVKKNSEQNQIFPIYRTINRNQKTPLYYKNLFQSKHTMSLSSRLKTAIRKALKDSISIQKYIFTKNNLSIYKSNRNFNFNPNYNNFDNKFEYSNQQQDRTNWDIEKVFDSRKENFNSEVLRSDKITIKELINQVYKKRLEGKEIDKIKLKLDYLFKNIINASQYKWNILNFEKSNKIKRNTYTHTYNKNKKEELFNLLSYLQNRTIREHLEINRKIFGIKNYNQIDSKFALIRASRHFQRARISQRKKLSQPIQKPKNFFHLEMENSKQINPFRIYQNMDSANLRIKLSKKDSVSSSDAMNSLFGLKLKNKQTDDKINNFIESYKIDIVNENQQNSSDVRNSNIFNQFKPFLESLYFLPRLSTLWQSNLINSNINSKYKIDMGSIYETKQNFTPIGTNKELYRQNFNTKNKIQDNIKRKLLDNHLNRFSERRRWTNQYQTINLEINEQLKKLIKIVKQNENILFSSQRKFDVNPMIFNLTEKVQPIEIQNNNQFYPVQPEFFSVDLQKSIQNLNIKETDQPQLLSLIINQKNQSKLKISQFSSLQLKNLFNKLKNQDMSFLKINQPNNLIFLNKNYNSFKKTSNFISTLNNVNSLQIQELILKKPSNFDNKAISNFNKEFFYDILLNNLILNSQQEIKKEKIYHKNKLLTIINQIQTNNSINKINKKSTQNTMYESPLSKNVEKYLLKNFQQKIENQLTKLEKKVIQLSEITKEELKNKQGFNEKQNKILITQKKFITKRIEFLTNLNEKFKAFEIWYLTLPTDWKLNKMTISKNRQSVVKANYFGFKNRKKQYYFSKKFVNLLVENCNNFIQYLDFKKEDYLIKQNKINSDLITLSKKFKKEIKEEINKLEGNRKNTLELTNNFKIQEFLQQPIKNLNNLNSIKINKNFVKSQQSDKRLPLAVDSSIIQSLLKKQKMNNFDEILGSILAIQKRGNPLSQKNLYYKKLKNEWNKNSFNNFSNSFFKRIKSRRIEERNGIKDFMVIRNWTRSQQGFQDKRMNQKSLEQKDIYNIIKVSSTSDKKSVKIDFENFIKESILKPQRFEKQQSRKRLKFKKLPRQEHFKNLQVWENYLKQKEDVKNKQIFDDLSQSFQKWKSFGFFPQKILFQKQMLNSATLIPFSNNNSTKNNKKHIQLYEYQNNLQTITNLDIIKQIEYDHLVQKEINLFLNQKNDFNQTNINSMSNKKILQIGDKDSKPLAVSFFISNRDLFPEIPSEINQEDQEKDLISKIYEKFFCNEIINDSRNTIDQDPSQINQKVLIGINSFPFYAGWDESLRKFVITNRLLSRRDAGYQTNSNMLFKEKENNFNIEFTKWPLQGRNAATTFYCHFPFINQPSDFSETIQYQNRNQFQQEEINPDIEQSEIQNKHVTNSNQFLEKNQSLSITRIKKQKQEMRNENRRNITNLVGPNDIQNRRKAIFYPLKWKSLRSNTKKFILKSPELQISLNNSNKFKTIDQLSYSNVRPLISKFHLLNLLRKGNTAKIRLPKLRPYKKYLKKENDILESSWRTFLSKRKLRSYNFIRQKNIRTMYLYKTQLGEKLKWTKMQWLFRKNNSRANRQSENRKNKSGTHYLRPRKKSIRRRSLGIKYKQNQQIWSFNNLRKNTWRWNVNSEEAYVSQQNEISKKTFNQTPIILTKKMNKYFLTDLSDSNFDKLQLDQNRISKQSQMIFYETPYNWIQPNNASNLYKSLFKTSSIFTPTLYSILPGHGRFLPKIQTVPLPKSSVQTIKRAIRLANFEPASFIQREVLSYEWSMKQLIQNINHRLNNSTNKLILKNTKNDFNQSIQNINSNSYVSIDLLIQRHLHLFKKKLINNPLISPFSNVYLSQFSRQRSFQKRSIRLRKFNMTLAMNLYDRWFFYYYTGGREDPLQNLFKSFEKLTQNISSSNIPKNNPSTQHNILDDSKKITETSETSQNNFIFKSVRKFLTQKPDQKRSFNIFLNNLKTKKSSPISKTSEKSIEQPSFLNTQKDDSSKNENTVSLESLIDEKMDYSMNQWWHILKLFPPNVAGKSAEKEMLDKLSNNKNQKKQQEKDLEEDRFYFLKANKSPIIQDFRSSKNVNRHYPLNGGFIWPGDYLRLQTIMVPKEKKAKYFYTKNLISEIKNSETLNNPNFQTSKSDFDSKSRMNINEKIQAFQNFVLESK